jgi:hypothetical protein
MILPVSVEWDAPAMAAEAAPLFLLSPLKDRAARAKFQRGVRAGLAALDAGRASGFSGAGIERFARGPAFAAGYYMLCRRQALSAAQKSSNSSPW